MRLNIAYGGTYLGRASVVPNPAQRTLEDRQGDCKDHAILFEALLASVGVDSSPVMVNASNAYRIPSVPTIGVLNHVMTWIPALQTFADSSARSIAFGDLPTVVSDKPALITKTGELSRTPAQRPVIASIELSGEIASDGEATFRLEDTARGWSVGARRQAFELAELEVLERAAEAMTLASGLIVNARPESVGGESGGGESGNNEEGGDETGGAAATGTARLRFGGRISGLVRGDPARELRVLSSVGGGIERALSGYFAPGPRTVPAVCGPAHLEERARWRLAPGLVLRDLPGGLAIDGEGFRYRSEFRRNGRVLEVRRSLRMDFTSNACSPLRLRTLQRLARDVLEDISASAPLRHADGASSRR